MPTEVLSPGPVWTLLQNVVYALPPVRCRLFTDSTAPALQQSNTLAFTANVVVALVDGAAEVSGGFIRATAAAGAIVTLKRA